MTYKLVIKPLAVVDLQNCYDWYEENQNGLGDKFLNRFEEDLKFLHSNPLHYQVRYKNVIRNKKGISLSCLHTFHS